MPDETQDLKTWYLHLAITPSDDGRFARINIELNKPSSRVPVYINSANSTDLLYERVQAELNNALRQVVNEIHLTVVKPSQRRK